MNEIAVAAITIIGGAIAGLGAESLRARAQTRTAAVQTSSDVHKADLDFDGQLMERMMKRLETVEVRLAESDKEARKRDEKIAALNLQLERVGNQYETNRKLQRRVANRLREEKPIDEETLLELENAPDFTHVLSGPNAPRQIGEGAT